MAETAAATQAPAIPLSMVHAGKTAIVAKVKGREDIRRHLGNLGFVEGSEIYVASSSGANLIVSIKGARFGLDTKVAQHIMVVEP